MFGELTLRVSFMPRNKPLFSIITCTLNSEKYLPEVIHSVINQTFTDYEHIFVDGFSKDNTVKLIQRYQEESSNPIVLYERKPQGISDAMNFGIKKSRGKYLMILHSDDYFSNNSVLSYVSTFLEKNKRPDWIYGQIVTVNESGKKIGLFPRYRIFKIASTFILNFVNYIPHQAVFIKKEVFNKFGLFDRKLKYCMDYDYWLRIKKSTKLLFIFRVITKYRIHKLGYSSSPENIGKVASERKRIQKKHLNTVIRLLSYPINFLIDRR